MKPRLLPQNRVRRTATSLAAVAVAVLAAGCQVASPVQTEEPYAPADGVQADLGEVALRDVVVVADGSGAGVVSGAALNQGAQAVTVEFAQQQQSGAGPASEVRLAPGEHANLAAKGVQLSGLTAKPGTVIQVSITTGAAGTTLLDVPVLPPEGYYATVTPTVAPTTASATTATTATTATSSPTTSG